MYTVRCGNELGLDWQKVAQTIAGWISQSVADGDALILRTVDEVAEQLREGWCAVVFDDTDSVVGYLTTYDLGVDGEGRNWWEVGTGIVPPEMRGHGIGAIMYNEIVKRHPKGVLVCTTKNFVALNLSVKAGFEIKPFSNVPDVIRQELCFTASCYIPKGQGCCISQQELGGTCYARIRWPLA